MSKYSVSKKQIKAEIVKCGKNPVYFINNYAKIIHPVKGLVPFKTYPFQSQLLEEFNNHRYNVILKARQLGISTITAAYILWMMMFSRNKNILVIATKFQTASNLVKKVKAMMKNLPEWMKITTISIDNRSSFELSNGSQIKASSTSSDAGRSEALSLLVVDEAAHIENMDELWAGLYPTISTGGRVIALSTPYGVGNWFHKVCSDAESGANDFFLTNLPWDVHPDRDQEWFENETKNLSKREIAQEYLCNFNASGETVIHPDDINYLYERTEEPKYRSGFDRNYWIWEEYDPTKKYIISADVARGDGRDFSTFHIMDVDNMDIVAEYRGKPSLDLYAQFLFDVGREYGEPLLVVENNNVGYSVIDKLVDMGYKNIYFSIKGSGEYIDSYLAESTTNSVPGFATSAKSRPLIIAKLEEFIRNKLIKIRSKRTINEMRTFVWNNGRPEAMRTSNDDLVMALAIACWVRDTAIIANRRNDDYKRALIGGMFLANTQIDVKVPGQEGYNQKSDLSKKRHEAKKQYEEFSWVYKG
tara:strand:- start:701 stop:2293 length:1593 start_codon:yes stop_codon:yes gene_type:complete